MFKFFSVFFLCFCQLVQADSITLPWQEFKQLYRDKLTQELQPESEETPFLYTLDAISHHWSLGAQHAQAHIDIKGRVLQGEDETIPLFPLSVAIHQIDSQQGGVLVQTQQHYSWRPLAENKAFELKLRLLLPIEEDQQSAYIQLQSPPAVVNRLRLSLPTGLQLLNPPGIQHQQDYYFDPSQALKIRFIAEQSRQLQRPLEIDALHRLSFQEQHARLESHYASQQNQARPLAIPVPAHYQYISSSLKPSQVRLQDKKLHVQLEAGDKHFSLQWQIQAEKTDHYQFELPQIINNNAYQGALLVDTPDAGQIHWQKPLHRLPISRLPATLRAKADKHAQFSQVSAPLTLHIQRFNTVSTPDVVLDSVYFFLALEDNGSLLWTLKITTPASAGPRLYLDPVPGAEIWSLTVNGQNKHVYALEQGQWVIPLAQGAASAVSLSYLLKGDKLGLQGRLDAQLPGLALPSQHLYLGLSLPKRLELVSLEADLMPHNKEGKWPIPRQFKGKHYFFEKAYDSGEGLSLSLFYKEPLDLNRHD